MFVNNIHQILERLGCSLAKWCFGVENQISLRVSFFNDAF